MKLTIEQGALQKALAAVVSVVARRNTIPVLANVLIDAQTGAADHEVWLIATDLDIEARIRVAASIERAGQITVPASLLSDIARAAGAGAEIVIDWDKAIDPRAIIRFGRSRYNLPVLPAGDFPIWRQTEWREGITVEARDLGHVLERSAFAVCTDQTRTYLLGAYLHVVQTDPSGRVLRSVATNGHCLAYAQCEAQLPDDVHKGCIVPTKTVGEFRRALDGHAGSVTLFLTPTGVRLETGDLILSSKIIDGDFPDYGRIIPSSWAHEITMDRIALAAAARRTALVSTERATGVTLAFQTDQVVLTVRNMETGMAQDELETDFTGEPFEVSLNARYLQDALNQTAADRIVFRIVDPITPVRLEPEVDDVEHASALAIIMPMRV